MPLEVSSPAEVHEVIPLLQLLERRRISLIRVRRWAVLALGQFSVVGTTFPALVPDHRPRASLTLIEAVRSVDHQIITVLASQFADVPTLRITELLGIQRLAVQLAHHRRISENDPFSRCS